jgi:hypothetical protein
VPCSKGKSCVTSRRWNLTFLGSSTLKPLYHMCEHAKERSTRPCRVGDISAAITSASGKSLAASMALKLFSIPPKQSRLGRTYHAPLPHLQFSSDLCVKCMIPKGLTRVPEFSQATCHISEQKKSCRPSTPGLRNASRQAFKLDINYSSEYIRRKAELTYPSLLRLGQSEYY